MQPRIVFFGTPNESLIVLNTLKNANFPIVAVVTKPPRPVGRKQILTETPVAMWAKQQHVQSITPQTHKENYWQYDDEVKFITQVLTHTPDILITADYTQLIPMNLIMQIKYGGLNVHPSLLPKYRGPAPVPWAIANGDTETGVSVVTLAEKFDEGTVVAQTKEQIRLDDTTDTLLTRLFEKGARLLIEALPKYIDDFPNNIAVKNGLTPSATPRLTRDHGYESWETVQQALTTGQEAKRIERKWRAFHPWPGIWTKVKVNNEEKRMKLLGVKIKENKLVIESLQIEGKNAIVGDDALKFLQTVQG